MRLMKILSNDLMSVVSKNEDGFYEKNYLVCDEVCGYNFYNKSSFIKSIYNAVYNIKRNNSYFVFYNTKMIDFIYSFYMMFRELRSCDTPVIIISDKMDITLFLDMFYESKDSVFVIDGDRTYINKILLKLESNYCNSGNTIIFLCESKFSSNSSLLNGCFDLGSSSMGINDYASIFDMSELFENYSEKIILSYLNRLSYCETIKFMSGAVSYNNLNKLIKYNGVVTLFIYYCNNESIELKSKIKVSKNHKNKYFIRINDKKREVSFNIDFTFNSLFLKGEYIYLLGDDLKFSNVKYFSEDKEYYCDLDNVEFITISR